MAGVIRVFLEDLPVRLAEIGDAVTHRNAANLRAAAHSLKVAASYLSLGGLFESPRGSASVPTANERRRSGLAETVGGSQQRHRMR